MEDVLSNPLEAAFDAPEMEEFREEDAFVPDQPLSNDTSSLLQVGYLTDVVTIGNHEIRIRTLKIGEELNCALLANRYKDTVEEARALATALVAAAIVSVDNAPLTGEILGPRDGSLENKFDFLLNNWYWEPIGQIWEAYNALLERVKESNEDLKKE